MEEQKPRQFWIHLNDKGEVDRGFEIVEGFFSCCGLGGPYIRVQQLPQEGI